MREVLLSPKDFRFDPGRNRPGMASLQVRSNISLPQSLGVTLSRRNVLVRRSKSGAFCIAVT